MQIKSRPSCETYLQYLEKKREVQYTKSELSQNEAYREEKRRLQQKRRGFEGRVSAKWRAAEEGEGTPSRE